MSYDYTLLREFAKTTIEYGIIEGGNIIVVLKAGQDGSIYGYMNKYLDMARSLHDEFGCTVIASSNPFNGVNPLDDLMDVINEYAAKKDYKEFEIYYFGTSNGAKIGLTWGYEYPMITKWILINSPLMINWHQLKKGLTGFKEKGLQDVFVIYGSKDMSYKYAALVKPFESEKIHFMITEGADHNFSDCLKTFMNFPKELFFGR